MTDFISAIPIGLSPLLRAHLDLARNVCEIRGEEHHKRILEYFRYVEGDFDRDEVHWCSAACCAWFEESLIESPRSPAAISWMNWGVPVVGWQNTKPGDMMVEWRVHPDDWRSHVSLIADWPVHSMTQTVIGGNQRERGVSRVCIKERTTDKVRGYRRAAR